MSEVARRIVQPESMRTQIHDDLRRRLQGSEFSAEDRLIDTEIARDYGTSRMPAREALLALTSQGFLRQTSRGFMVPVLMAVDIRDIFEVRKLLEPAAAGQACGLIGREGLKRLAGARDLALKAGGDGDTKALMVANMDFRAVWIDALTNNRLRMLVESFADHAQMVRISTLGDIDIQTVVINGLGALYDGFAARDAAAVTARMADFVAAAEAEYFRCAQKQGAI